MANDIQNRNAIFKALADELMGPAPRGKEIDFTKPVTFKTVEESYGPWRQQGSGEEVLQRDQPAKRYGVGVLFPFATEVEEQPETRAGIVGSSAEVVAEVLVPDADADRARIEENVDKITKRLGDLSDPDTDDDLDLSLANSYRPSSIAVSTLVDLPEGAELVVQATGGRYAKTSVNIAGIERLWWLRRPVSIHAVLPAKQLGTATAQMVRPKAPNLENAENWDINVEVFSRPYGEKASQRLLTICLVNRTRLGGGTDESTLFQAWFRVTVIAPDGGAHIMPYYYLVSLIG